MKAPVAFVSAAGLVGALGTWFLAGLLLPADLQYVGILPIGIGCCGMTVGLFIGVIIARRFWDGEADEQRPRLSARPRSTALHEEHIQDREPRAQERDRSGPEARIQEPPAS